MNNSRGFTLLELLIVIAVISILAATLIPNLLNARGRAAQMAGQVYARQVMVTLESLQYTNSDLRYIDTAAPVSLTNVSGEVLGVSLGSPATTFAQATVREELKNGSNGIGLAVYYPGAANNFIEVSQTVNGKSFCHELQINNNSVVTTLVGTCNGTLN